MKQFYRKVIFIAAPLLLMGGGCPAQQTAVPQPAPDAVPGPQPVTAPAPTAQQLGIPQPDTPASAPQAAPAQPSAPAGMTFNGKVISEGATPIIEFNRADYEAAVAAGRLVVVTFYANWCPICASQQPEHFRAMRQLSNPDVVAFRANYKDSDTDSEEEDIAREFGIAFQDTKVIVKNGQRVVKSTEFWSADKYLNEINTNL